MDNKTEYRQALEKIHDKLLMLGEKYDSVSPGASAHGGIYEVSMGIDWTDSFYVGMLWLDWVRTKDEHIKRVIDMQMWEFEQRLKQNRGLNNHDIGFLYILSAVAGYKAEGKEKYRDMAIRAARLLAKRYHEKAKFIQAWGDINGRENYRLIIDCMLNIPLLYWAAEQINDRELFDIAYQHAKTTQKVIFRPDASAYHTYYFDYDTSAPLYGKTKQGAGDDTAWSRGQAWAIYGFAISSRYCKDKGFLNAAKNAARYFLGHLPEDKVAYWDLCFNDGSDEPRDSSAAAIAACGLLEIDELTGGEKDGYYKKQAEEIILSLCRNYMSDKDSESMLDHAVYSIPDNVGIDEACIWGDYYFTEALTRLADEKSFVRFW